MLVIKRDGRTKEYDQTYIEKAVKKAFLECYHDEQKFNEKIGHIITDVNQKVYSREEEKINIEDIQDYVYKKTNSHERANEQARYVLPMATHASFIIGFTIEALFPFMNMRFCVRAEDKIHELAKLMKKSVLEVISDKAIENYLVPNCQYLQWCPEGKKGCGAYPTKKELQDFMKKYKSILCQNEEIKDRIKGG